MIISFSGRKSAGKTTLANELQKDGFVKISFASELKRLVSVLYGWEISDLSNTIKKEEILTVPAIWDKDKARQLESIIGASRRLDCAQRSFKTRREVLQYVGTDILRKYDSEFHVNSIKKQILPNTNYVLDDVRFLNELNLLRKLGAHCIYVMRPYFFDDYSNHRSEIELNRTHFSHLLLNNRDVKHLVKKFRGFKKLILSPKRAGNIDRETLTRLFKKYKTTKTISKHLKCSRDKVVWWAGKHLIPISRNEYKLDESVFLSVNKESAYWAGLLSADGCIKRVRKYNYVLEFANTDKELIDGFCRFFTTDKKPYSHEQRVKDGFKRCWLMTINSPYVIDDMKLWNLEPRKSRHNKVPDCVKDNDDLFNPWLVGLIDGDGCICITKSKQVIIRVLASLEIINFIHNRFPKGKIYSEKGIKNLYAIQYNGKNAVELYREIYSGVGLKRKWNKVVPFLKKNWLH